jgi:hypothetical protein
MRYTYSGLGAGFVPSGGSTISTHPTLASKAVAYYKFDETSGTTTADEVGSNDGTLANVTSTSSGKFNNAFDYDSNNDKITVGSDWITTSSDVDFFVSLWINPNDIAGTGTGKPLVFQNNANGNREWGLFYYTSTLSFVRWVGSGVNAYNFAGTNTLTQGVLQHVIMSYDASENEVTFYLNDVSETITATGPGSANVGTLKGFGSASNSIWYMNGIIDECLIGLGTLSAAEASFLYSSGAGVPYN